MMPASPEIRDPTPGQPDWLLAGVAAIVALASRLAFLLGAPDRAWPHSLLYEGDAPVWVAWARALHAGLPFEYDLPLRTPGVAYLLHWLTPGPIVAPFTGWKVAWCAISAATCGVAYLAFRRAFPRREALVATGLLVFSYGSLVTATSLNNETPYTFLLVLIVWLTLIFNGQPRWSLALGLGALHGLATLLRAEHTLLLLGLLVLSGWMLARGNAERRAAGTRRAGPPLAAGLLVILLASVIVCLPRSIHGSRAIRQYNTVTDASPDYARASVPWTPEARAALEALPAFARDGNFQFITARAAQARREMVTEREVAQFFDDVFGYVPEPMSTWVVVSSKGPLDFALANHPGADGGFSRAALDDGLGPDPPLDFRRPSHLRLYNRGLAAGLRFIADDPLGWLGLVAKKLRNFGDGVTLGLTSMNLPYRRAALRRPVDLATPPPAAQPWWRAGILLLLATGIVVATRRRRGGTWLLVIVYKLIVTILFYGYARQAVSIQPAFAIFLAVAIGWGLDAAAARMGALRRWGLPAAGALVVGLLALDFTGSFRSRQLEAQPLGPRSRLVLDETMAPDALRSDDPLELIPRPAAPP